MYNLTTPHICSRIVLLTSVACTLILGLPPKKWPPHWIYYASNAYISAKTLAFALMRAFVKSTTEGKAN